MSHRIKRFAPVFAASAVLAALGGCAVYPAEEPGYGSDYYGYGGAPMMVQPEVSVGIGGAYGPGYYDRRRGDWPGYRRESNSNGHPHPDNGAHYRGGDSGPHNAPPGSPPNVPHNAPPNTPPPGGRTGGPADSGASAGRPGGSAPQAGGNGGQRGGGYGGNGGGSGGGNNRAAGRGYGQRSDSQ